MHVACIHWQGVSDRTLQVQAQLLEAQGPEAMQAQAALRATAEEANARVTALEVRVMAWWLVHADCQQESMAAACAVLRGCLGTEGGDASLDAVVEDVAAAMKARRAEVQAARAEAATAAEVGALHVDMRCYWRVLLACATGTAVLCHAGYTGGGCPPSPGLNPQGRGSGVQGRGRGVQGGGSVPGCPTGHTAAAGGCGTAVGRAAAGGHGCGGGPAARSQHCRGGMHHMLVGVHRFPVMSIDIPSTTRFSQAAVSTTAQLRQQVQSLTAQLAAATAAAEQTQAQLHAAKAAQAAQAAELGSLRDEVGTLQQVLHEESSGGKRLHQEASD